MVIDFHMHGKITNQFPFEIEEFQNKVEEAKRQGMDCLTLTEHSHAKNFDEAYRYLEENFTYLNHYYLVNGIKVFVGVEVTTEEKLDVLVIGERKQIICLNQKIVEQTKETKAIAMEDLMNMIETENFLVILAHPYRKHEELPKIDAEVFKKFDAIEINARDLNDYGIEKMKDKVEKLGGRLQLPRTGGSDSHYFLQVGSIQNRFQKECNTVQEIKEQIRLKQYRVEISNELPIRIRASKIIKKLIVKGK